MAVRALPFSYLKTGDRKPGKEYLEKRDITSKLMSIYVRWK